MGSGLMDCNLYFGGLSHVVNRGDAGCGAV